MVQWDILRWGIAVVTIRDALLVAIEWCVNHPSFLLWVLLPAGLMFFYACWRILHIAGARKHDHATIRKLIKYQEIAKVEEHDSEERLGNYLNILSRYPSSTIGLSLYKYAISHEDFSNILSAISYKEYNKVGRVGLARSKFARIWILDIFVIPLILLGTVWGGAVAVASATNMFADAVVDGTLGSAALHAGIPPLIAMLFVLAVLTLVIVYQRIGIRDKRSQLAALSFETPSFFQNMQKEDFQMFAQAIEIQTNPSEKVGARIRRILKREGVSVVAPQPVELLVSEIEEVEELFPIEEELVEEELIEEQEAVQVVEEIEEEGESLSVDDIIEKFADMPFSPPPALEITPEPPQIEIPVEVKVVEIEPEPVVVEEKPVRVKPQPNEDQVNALLERLGQKPQPEPVKKPRVPKPLVARMTLVDRPE